MLFKSRLLELEVSMDELVSRLMKRSETIKKALNIINASNSKGSSMPTSSGSLAAADSDLALFVLATSVTRGLVFSL